MSYLNTHERTSKPSSQDSFQPLGRNPMLNSIYLGFVKDVADVQKMGRLRVWIPELGSTPDEEAGWIIVDYCSPFAGATNAVANNTSDYKIFEGTQTSYGMWMIPPDLNNQVLVMFVNGDPTRGVWVGCLYNQFMNHMVPGMAVNKLNYQYNGKDVPVAEYNKYNKSITIPDQALHPFEATKFKGLGTQGLITDPQRGTTTSSARREAPSRVFGILTPGPLVNPNVPQTQRHRKGGSSLIMDDEPTSEYIQFATKSGAQIRISETNGFVYIVNRDGTGWIQIDQNGNIDVFAAANISLRAQRDFNIRADRNINIEAGQDIYIKAAKDTKETTSTFTFDVNNVPRPATPPYWKFVGEGKGEGGNIVTQALANIHTTAQKNYFINVKENNLEIKVAKTIDISAGTEYNLTAPSIRNVGAVKIRGTLDVTGATKLGDTLGVNKSINGESLSVSGAITGASLSLSGGITAGTIVGDFPGLRSGPGATTGGPGSKGSAGPAVNIPVPPEVVLAEIRAMVEKINILWTWADPDSKFKRDAESWQTTVSRLNTFEPCPEHEKFTYKAVTGYTPTSNEGDKTYNGSGGAGNEATTSPPTNTTPGANNVDIPPPPPVDSAVTKDFNMAAYECQLKRHEGVKFVSYLDTKQLPTAGIGHLLRDNEKSIYPVPTKVTEAQVSAWFQEDAPTSIKGAQQLLGIDTWGDLSDVRKRACADLCYNMGKPRLSKFVRFIAAMKAKDYNLAGQSLRESLWFGQVGQRGPAIISMIVNNIDVTGCDKKFPPTSA